MDVTRRTFIQVSGAVAAGIAMSGCAGMARGMSPVKSYAHDLRFENGRESHTICCYCAVGCGAIVHTSKKRNGRTLYIEGDPDHVINRGALCSKGSSIKQLCENENRILEPMHRAPYSDKWETVSWDWALNEIAKKVKQTRDATFVYSNDQNETVNRTTGIASVGSAALDNEECWIYQSLLRSLGIVYIEHQARI
jgi:formate dehydrogenase major subunit